MTLLNSHVSRCSLPEVYPACRKRPQTGLVKPVPQSRINVWEAVSPLIRSEGLRRPGSDEFLRATLSGLTDIQKRL